MINLHGIESVSCQNKQPVIEGKEKISLFRKNKENGYLYNGAKTNLAITR
jgi:hypothetical protein